MPPTFHRVHMQKAFDLAKLCKSEEGRASPKVGCVVVRSDGTVLAESYRGQEPHGPGDHAEFIALEKRLGNQSVAGATVYTTLEPCTTRSHEKIPCANRLVERQVGAVCIGMLDPNQEIRGRGDWLLTERNIAIGRFDPDLVRGLLEINRDFIRDQQSLGFRIATPLSGDLIKTGESLVRGTYVNKPRQDGEVVVWVRHMAIYWPQSRLAVRDDGHWEAQVTLGKENDVAERQYGILVTRITEDIAHLVAMYYEVAKDPKNAQWRGREFSRLPKGIHVMDEVEVVRC